MLIYQKNCTSATPLKLLIRICFCYIEFDFKICNNIHIYVPRVHHTCNPAINATEGAITTVIALQGRGNKGLVYEGIQIQDRLHLLLSLTPRTSSITYTSIDYLHLIRGDNCF